MLMRGILIVLAQPPDERKLFFFFSETPGISLSMDFFRIFTFRIFTPIFGLLVESIIMFSDSARNPKIGVNIREVKIQKKSMLRDIPGVSEKRKNSLRSSGGCANTIRIPRISVM